MLIKCPECKREISKLSKVCIHCGFPLEEKVSDNICIINGKGYDFFIVLKKINEDEPMGLVIRSIRDICNMALNDAKRLYDIINDTKEIPDEFNCNEIYTPVSRNVPKCPTCNSADLKKISGLSKATSVAMWGLLSQKVKKTFHCNSCGYEW